MLLAFWPLHQARTVANAQHMHARTVADTPVFKRFERRVGSVGVRFFLTFFTLVCLPAVACGALHIQRARCSWHRSPRVYGSMCPLWPISRTCPGKSVQNTTDKLYVQCTVECYNAQRHDAATRSCANLSRQQCWAAHIAVLSSLAATGTPNASRRARLRAILHITSQELFAFWSRIDSRLTPVARLSSD